MFRPSLLLTTLAALLLAVGANATDRLYDSFDDEQLELMLEQEGYTAVTIIENGLLRFAGGDSTFSLYRYDDGDLQLYFALAGVHVSFLDINEWNQTRRLSRSYLDDDGDPVLEADLLSDGRLSVKNVKEFVRVFILSAEQFERFIRTKHGG